MQRNAFQKMFSISVQILTSGKQES